jgi:hypothetical protein
LKHADARSQKSIIGGHWLRNGGIVQVDMRVSLPSGLVYVASIVDGASHYQAWRVLNMSMGGVLLEMDVGALREGQVVDFLLRYERGARGYLHRLPAKVARIQLNGAALQFNYYDASTYDQLVELLHPT